MADNKMSFGGGHGRPSSRFDKKSEKLRDPKGSIKRILKYLSDKKIILVMVFIFCVITTLVSILGTKLNGEIVDKYILTGDMLGLVKICIVLAFMYLVSSTTTFIQNRAMIKISQKTSAKIRMDLFESIQKLPINYFDTHQSGDLMSRLTNDVDNINMTLSQSVTSLFSGIINIVGMLIAMIILNPLLTIVGLITTPIMFIITRSLVKIAQPFFVKQQKELGKLNGYVEEIVSGQKAVLLFSEEEYATKEFSKINRRLTRASIKAQIASGFMGPINNFINNLTYLIIAVAGGILVLKGSISIGVVFTFVLYMRNFTRPINEILNIFNTIQSALAGAERVFEVMDAKPESDSEDAKDVSILKGRIVIKNIDFSYDTDKKILKNASIDVKEGQTVAIVGPTGAGKTTIINLLTKFYDIDSGEILIDGENIDNITRKSLRKNIAVVLQDTFLFSETVMENIRYGRLDATDEEVIKAAKLANIHHFIKQMPKGYDTLLSDGGSSLSQGQRQLLAIARAILSNSSILILDEATSSIDTRTEVEIQKAMLNLMEGRTTFVIAHRLSTIKNADQILVLNDGEIIERGTHEILLNRNGFYANLYNSQFKH